MREGWTKDAPLLCSLETHPRKPRLASPASSVDGAGGARAVVLSVA